MHDMGAYCLSGHYKGKLYSEYNETITILIKMSRLAEAEKLLLELINAIESDDTTNNISAPIWYYSNLANVYHKRRDIPNEIKTLETFVEKNNTTRTTLHERLDNLKYIKTK